MLPKKREYIFSLSFSLPVSGLIAIVSSLLIHQHHQYFQNQEEGTLLGAVFSVESILSGKLEFATVIG